MELKEVESLTLKDSVYKRLQDAIVSGGIPPGVRLTLKGLAEQLGVSVMPVRDAIRKLEAGNFITIEKRRITVNKLSPENVYQILEARLLLEGYAAEKACLQRSLATLDELEDALQQMKDASGMDVYIMSNRHFHETLYAASGAPVILETISTLWDRYTPYLAILNEQKRVWDSEVFIETHTGILMGMRRKAPMEIRKWLEKDLTGAAELIVDLLVGEREKNPDKTACSGI